MLKAAQAYLQTQVNTTSQAQLLLMLYDGGIKFLKQAKVKIEERNYAEKGILISKGMDIIAELDGSLNAEKGGELATNLHNLYFYCNTRLLQANLKMDVGLIDEVVEILSSLREAFAQISGEAPQQQNASAQAPAGGGKAKAFGQAAGVSAQSMQSMQAAKPPRPSGQAGQNAQPGKETGDASAAPRSNVSQMPKQAAPSQKEARPAPKQAAPQQQGEKHETAAKNPESSEAAPAQEQKPQAPATPKQSRLLAGANIYKRMASQNS